MEQAELERLQQDLRQTPGDNDLRLALLQLLVAAERWPDAAETGTPLLHEAAAPGAAVHTLMGLVYSKQARPDEALHQCRQALALQPDDALLLFNLGTLLAQQGQFHEAQEHLARAIAQQEDWAAAHYNLGTVLLRLERYREAIDAFERATAACDTYPDAHFNRGNAHAMKALDASGTLDYYELDGAINAYKKAIQQRPGYTAALYNLGMVYKRMTSSEGLRVWDQYLDVARDDPEEEVWRLRAAEYKRDLQDRLH